MSDKQIYLTLTLGTNGYPFLLLQQLD